MPHALLVIAAAVVACTREGAEPAPTLGADPPHGPLTGYYPVRFDLAEADAAPDEVRELRVGPNRAYDLTADGDGLVATVQGAPDAGPQDVTLVSDGGEQVFPGAFTYDPPRDPRFDRVFALGASLTEGVQGGVPTRHGGLHDPALLAARQLGAYFALPVLVEPLFPAIGWADIGPAPACEVPDVVAHVSSAAVDVLSVLADDTGSIVFANARVDPGLAPRNVAVGGSRVADLVHGPPDDLTALFVVKMVYAPDADLADPVPTSQLDLAERLGPSLVMIADTYGNDMINALLASNGVDLGELTPPDALRADLDALCARLSATGAEVFVANLPRPSLLPASAARRAAFVAGGGDPAVFDADVAEVDAMGEVYRGLLDEVAAGYPQVHVVDFHGAVDALVRDGGVDVAGHRLTVSKFGGLIGTDGVHFGDVGYGLVAQLFVDAIADTLGVPLDPVDLDLLYASDPFSPDAARAAGVDPAACE